MNKSILLFIFSFTAYQILPAQCLPTGSQILHFTKTNGFDHNTRDQSAQMFTEIGISENFTITNTHDALIFDDPNVLDDYSIIIFSNTSGNNLLNASQQTNMEAFINAGGNFLGIHAATDTYRNGAWPFYNNLVGGIVQTNPNHTSSNHVNDMDLIVPDHPVLEGLPNPWNKEEEYYYWELNGGWLSPDISELLRVRSTGGNSYDEARPTAWLQQFPSGARSFYTSLGHKRSNFTDPTNEFRLLLKNALCWLMTDPILSISNVTSHGDKDALGNTLYWSNSQNIQSIKIYRGEDIQDLAIIYQTDDLDEIKLAYFRDKNIDLGKDYFYQLEINLHDGTIESLPILFLGRQNEKQLLISPNPSKSYFTIQGEIDPSNQIEIYSSNGQLIYKSAFQSANIIATSNWKPGIYLIKLIDSNGKHFIEKLINQHC